MSNLETIKHNLIDKILASSNEKILTAINNILETNDKKGLVTLSTEQIKILEMSINDISNGDFISEDELEKSDSKWMN